jgi:hypothetical protein
MQFYCLESRPRGRFACDPPPRTPFSTDSGAEPGAGPGAAGHGHARHRPSQRRIRRARQGGAGGIADNLQDHQSGHHLSLVRHRRLGGRHRQHAVAGRQGADGRDRALRHAVAADGGEMGHRSRFRAGRLAPRRRSGCHRGEADGGQEPRAQGRDGRAQRDLHRRHQPDRRCAPRSIAPSIRRC